MVYEPEIVVHKSMSSRLREGETRNNKTLQQTVRTHVPKRKKKREMCSKKKPFRLGSLLVQTDFVLL